MGIFISIKYNMVNLADVRVGKCVEIDKISQQAPTKIKRRLLDLGFTKGVKIRVLKKSLLKEDILIEIRNFTLTIRRDIAQYILVS